MNELKLRPARCRLRCGSCFVYQSRNPEVMPEAHWRQRVIRLPDECRSCGTLEQDGGVCWGAVCSMRNCCSNCGLGYGLQCRRHPCRDFFRPGADEF